MSKGLFFTGTGTEVGKTYVTALVARYLVAAGVKVGVYKPVASGCIKQPDGSLVSEDAVALWEAAGKPGTLQHVCPQRFAAPLAPHLAAKAEGKEVDTKLLTEGIEYWQKRSDVVLIEGAGGLMSPIAEEMYNADLADALGYPLIVVSANQLGTINHTLQTLIAAAAYGNGLPVEGVILNQPHADQNDPSTASNLEELSTRCISPVLATVAFGAEKFSTEVAWENLAQESSFSFDEFRMD